MGAVAIAMGLAKLVPSVIGLFKGDKAEEKAEKVLDVVKGVTGIGDPQGAIAALEKNPQLLLEFKGKMMDHLAEMRELELKEQEEHNRHVAEMEGTAKDLLAVPVLGQIMLFLRGSQRIVWGFGALWITYCVLAGKWVFVQQVMAPNGVTATVTDTQRMFLVISIDLLVLATLFGERALRNILPIVLDKLMPIFSRK